MSERKVIQKYYPPDFDPSALARKKGGPKQVGPKFVPVRLMAPFSMQCTRCGEYIAKGRKFNARKEVTGETYLAIKIIRFYIRCTRCSGEITFCTDPRNNDYTCERGAKRNYEPWRDQDAIEETDEQRLDRLEAEEAQESGDVVKEVDAMTELENSKRNEAPVEMAIADALDRIRRRNARLERAEKEDLDEESTVKLDEELTRQEEEDQELARRAFSTADGEKVRRLADDDDEEEKLKAEKDAELAATISFAPKGKKRKGTFAIPGIKKKLVAS